MKFTLKAWNIGNYTTSLLVKQFDSLHEAMDYSQVCNRTKIQIIDTRTRELVYTS
jgi:hypothetical protein